MNECTSDGDEDEDGDCECEDTAGGGKEESSAE